MRLVTDGSTTDDGWYVDGVRVVEHEAPAAVGLPWYERFGDGVLTNWLSANWRATTNGVLDGEWCAVDTEGHTYAPNLYNMLVLGRGLNLAGTTNPVLTVWMRGQLWWRTRMRVQMSADGGSSWGDLLGYNYDVNWANWTRLQVTVPEWARVNGARLRIVTWSEWETQPDQNWYVDKLTIEELPPNVVLHQPDQATAQSLRLRWTAYAGGDFESYHVYRSTAPEVGLGHTLLAVITNANETEWTDQPLRAGCVYYYRVYVMNTNNTVSGSNESSARTLGVPVPSVEDFETEQSVWTFEGTWGRLAGVGRNGGVALASAPGDYPHNADMSAHTAINPAGMNWPTLTFWERGFMGSGDWAYLEVSGNDGASWSRVYGTYGVQTNWVRRVIDLSPWKNAPMIRVRFRLTSDGSVAGAGWHLDDLRVEDHADTPVNRIYERFESPLDSWLDGGWMLTTNAYGGNGAASDLAGRLIAPNTAYALVYGASIDLAGVPHPVLTYWLKGALWWRTRFRAQVSVDGGIGWIDVHAINSDFNQGWQKYQFSLAAYTNTPFRLRFVTWSEWDTAPSIGLYLDHIGVGAPFPSAPAAKAPAQNEIVGMLRPVLQVWNAEDAQSDPLSYAFEVYADASLQTLVAQVPSVAAGESVTVWQVDTTLADNAQYWWRCQASDGANVGPWMATATFYVNETNAPPWPVVIAGPPNGAVMRSSSYALSWYATTDPGAGDTILDYHIQIADNPVFEAPLVDDAGIVIGGAPTGGGWLASRQLKDLAGVEAMAEVKTYYWRIRARDSRYRYSEWSAGPRYFTYPLPPPAIQRFETLGDGRIRLRWDQPADSVWLLFSPTLTADVWQVQAGPLTGAVWSITPDTNHATGFFRLEVRD